jgi:translation initiation factor IF-2
MMGLLAPEMKERVTGHAEIRQVFQVGKNTRVAGCHVTQGSATPKSRARVKRADSVLFEGGIASMRHFENDVSEVKEGMECGIRLEKFSGFEAGDILEFYVLDEMERKL